MQTLKHLSGGLLRLLYPRLCEGCRRPLLQEEEVICLHCESRLSWTDFHQQEHNESVLRIAGRFAFVHASALLYFNHDSLAQHLIHRLKYSGRKKIGLYLGGVLGRALKSATWGVDLIVPVPLHRRKESLRGFNQSELIAKGLSAVLEVPVCSDAVIRSRNTATQTDKDRAERIANVAEAFRVVQPDLLTGKHLLLVDDVLTTGATLESLALEVLKLPEVRVSVATCGVAHG